MLALAAEGMREAGRLLALALCWMGIGVGALVVAISVVELWMQRRGFAVWRDIARGDGLLKAKGDPGLLRKRGCVLGAIRRHVLASWRILRMRWGQTLFLGEPELVNAALRAVVRDWDGALVYVDSMGGSAGLDREAIRVTPDRPGGAAYNPMLAIRRDVHDFADARLLAGALLPSAEARLVQSLAALILDQLYTAPETERTLSALRRRVLDEPYIFERMAAHVHVQHAPDGPWLPHPEIRRVARAGLADASQTQSTLAAIRKALAPFGDGRLQEASSRHQVDPGALVSGDGPTTLILEISVSDPHMAPFCASLLAQLVAACTEAETADHLGRRKQRQVLLVIDDASALSFVPLLQRRLTQASRCGVHLCVGARSLEAVAQLFGLRPDEGARAAVHFQALAAIGPQERNVAETLAHMAGGFTWFDWLWPRSWRDVVLPKFRPAARDYAPAEDLEHAQPGRALIFAGRRRPIWAKAALQLSGGAGKTLDPRMLPDAPHDWSAAPPPFEVVEDWDGARGDQADRRRPARAPCSPPVEPAQGELILTGSDNQTPRVTSSDDLRQALTSKRTRARTV